MLYIHAIYISPELFMGVRCGERAKGDEKLNSRRIGFSLASDGKKVLYNARGRVEIDCKELN